MRTDSIVYRRIAGRIAELGLTRRDVADQLGVSYGTLHNKLCAITPFLWDEVRTLAALLHLDSLDKMMMRSDQDRKTWPQ